MRNQFTMIAALMLSTVGSLRLPPKPDSAQLTKATGRSFQDEPISVSLQKNTDDTMEATMQIGKVSVPIYDRSDEPLAFFDTDEQTEFDLSKCSVQAATELAQKYPVEKVPKASSKSALPKGSFYASLSSSSSEIGCNSEFCQVPTYLPARATPKSDQKIPRIIWMTLSNGQMKAGPFHYNLLAEHFNKNPEYEWVASDDETSKKFMNSEEVKPSWTKAYNSARNGAEKADIWRYAVMYKYGGVYMDTDMTAQKPLGEIIDGTADFAQQLLKKKKGREATQFVLMYAPKHPIMEAVLDQIAAKFSNEPPRGRTNGVTGPGAMSQAMEATGAIGMQMCKDGYHLCGEPTQPAAEKNMGKAQFFLGGRDLDCGQQWHKADGCAIMEARSKTTQHW